MTHRCSVHGGDVPDHEAQLLDPAADECTSGPGRAPVYACRACVRDGGLVPLAEHRLDAPPIAPGRST